MRNIHFSCYCNGIMISCFQYEDTQQEKIKIENKQSLTNEDSIEAESVNLVREKQIDDQNEEKPPSSEEAVVELPTVKYILLIHHM